MRQSFAILFIVMILALIACVSASRRSYRAIGKSVSVLLGSLIPPVLGNLLIILSGNETVATLGCYIYFIGMDFVMVALLRFTFDYCNLAWPSKKPRITVYSVLALDVIQFLINPLTGHAFTTEAIEVEGFNYYRVVAHIGQTFHRVIDYGIFAAIVVVFAIKLIRSPKIHREKFLIILFTMVMTVVWQTYYIFSRKPVDRSMAGYGVFGLLIFYFALYYRPMTLLDRMLANMASDTSEALFFFDADKRCIWANQPAIDLVGIKGEKFDQALDLLAKKFGAREFSNVNWDGDQQLGSGEAVKYYHFEKRMLTDKKERIAGSFLSIRDQTDEHIELEREKYNVRHDNLTDLYTKQYLYERIEARLAEEPQENYLIIYVDVMDFKVINDVFGTDYGDYALCKISDWIRKKFPQNSVYGRLTGDTFGILIPKENFNKDEVETILSKFEVDDGNVSHQLQIHLGVYEVPKDLKDVSVMFDRAHLALSTIKDEYQVHIAVYDDKIRNEVLWAQKISGQLQDALKNRDIRPYFQPIVDIYGNVVGAEALARWIHPKEGFLSPASFIPVMEKNGTIVEVDKYMWRCACEILSSWKDRFGDFFISVNISPKDFYFMDVYSVLLGLVKEYGIDPARLRIEITETVMMTDVENRMKILEDLRRAGFIVEMDDFGSGYSSLNMLKDMPVDVLKIDMRFLYKATDDIKAQTILQNIINLSDNLGMFSLTEGVETQRQHAMLTEMGCKLFQGYYFAKPMTQEKLEEFLDGRTRLTVEAGPS